MIVLDVDVDDAISFQTEKSELVMLDDSESVASESEEEISRFVAPVTIHSPVQHAPHRGKFSDAILALTSTTLGVGILSLPKCFAWGNVADFGVAGRMREGQRTAQLRDGGLSLSGAGWKIPAAFLPHPFTVWRVPRHDYHFRRLVPCDFPGAFDRFFPSFGLPPFDFATTEKSQRGVGRLFDLSCIFFSLGD